jgi:hypothetical protein
MELPVEAAQEIESPPTDVIPPTRSHDDSPILETEVLPERDVDTGEYDLSMIVDATRQSVEDLDTTAKDLQAVQVETNPEEYTISDDTLNNEVDYTLLEQDYEEELTATQALNQEIAKAARELADRMAEEETAEITAEAEALQVPANTAAPEDTTEMPRTEQTAQTPPRADSAAEAKTIEMPSVSEPDNTAQLTANIVTGMDADNDDEVDSPAVVETIEMAAAGSDVTVEMQVESGRVDTKKKKNKK